MWVDELVTSRIVEQGLAKLPWLDASDEFATYEQIEKWNEAEAAKPEGPKHRFGQPTEWTARIAGPLLAEIVEIDHGQVLEALRALAFRDRHQSAWGQSTGDIQDWARLDETKLDQSPRLSNETAADVLLFALYGEEGRHLSERDQ